MCAEDTTGSSLSAPRYTTIFVFSIAAHAFSSSSLQRTAHASLRWNVAFTGTGFAAPVSSLDFGGRSKTLSTPEPSMAANFVPLQFKAKTRARHLVASLPSDAKPGRPNRSIAPDFRATSNVVPETATAVTGSLDVPYADASPKRSRASLSTWNVRVASSSRASPPPPYRQRKTTERDATATCVALIAAASGSTSIVLDATGDPMASHRVSAYEPGVSPCATSTQRSPAARIRINRLTCFARVESSRVESQNTTRDSPPRAPEAFSFVRSGAGSGAGSGAYTSVFPKYPHA